MRVRRQRCMLARLASASSPHHTTPPPLPRSEDLKHLKAKLKKLEEKAGKDGTKAQELQAELACLQEDVPALQARAADLELQLAKAQEVRGRRGGGGGQGLGCLHGCTGHAWSCRRGEGAHRPPR